MMRFLACVLTFVLLVSTPIATMGKPSGGGGTRGGGANAAARPAGGTANRPSGSGGFNLNKDIGGTTRAPTPSKGTANRPSGPNKPSTLPSGGTNVANRPAGGSSNVNRPSGGSSNVNRPSGGNTNVNRPGGGNTNVNRPGGGNTINSGNVNISGNTINRNVYVQNPVYRGPAWGWNHGVVWAPAPYYYGGGFWGAFTIGVASAVVFGAIVNSTTHQTVTSYQVQPSSPGATMLANYQLTQVQCGPPNLVVVYGPNNSVICANPNNLVAAGEYNLDTSTLSLTSL